MAYTSDTLPHGLPGLRTGTANDGRMLIAAPVARQESILRDIRKRLPTGWTAEIYRPSGVDVVISHVWALEDDQPDTSCRDCGVDGVYAGVAFYPETPGDPSNILVRLCPTCAAERQQK